MVIRHFLPSPFFIAIVGTLLCIGGVAALFHLYTREDVSAAPAPATMQLAAQVGTMTRERLLEGDSDKDGLLDWEEILWETDPDRADTDGDGVSDGEEVQANRDPLVSGTGSRGTGVPTGTTQATTTELTTTDTVARELFGTYIALKQTGTLDAESSQQMLETLLSRSVSAIQPPLYTQDELTLTPVNTFEAYTRYKNSLLAAFEPTEGFVTHELILVARINEQNDAAAEAELAAVVDALTKVEKNLVAIEVPSGVAPIHMDFLNSYAALAFIIRSFATIQDDPLRVAATVSLYPTAEARVSATKKALFDFVANVTSS